jgi:hypothetical protein
VNDRGHMKGNEGINDEKDKRGCKMVKRTKKRDEWLGIKAGECEKCPGRAKDAGTKEKSDEWQGKIEEDGIEGKM